MAFWPSCSIIFVGVVLPPSALFCVPTPLPSLVGSLRHFVSLRGVFSLFFRADISSLLFFGVCPFHFLAAVFLFALAPSLSGYGFLSFALWLFSLSLPSSVSAPLLRCFCYTCCFCLGGSPLTCFSSPLSLLLSAVPYQLPVALASPSLLVTCLSPSGVRDAVLCAYFFISPSFSSRLLSGWGVVNPSVPSFLGFLSRWQCSSLAWAVGSYGPGIDFLGLCCSPSLFGVVGLFLVLAPSPVRFDPFLVQCLSFLLSFPLRFVSELPLLPSVPLTGALIPVWGVFAPITRCLTALSSGSSLLFLGLGLLISCSVF